MRKLIAIAAALILFGVVSSAQGGLLGTIETIGTKYGVSFVYDASLRPALEAGRPAVITSSTLEEALGQAFKNSGITWQVKGRNVVLKPARRLVRRAASVTISGHITDASSAETLIGAGVLADGNQNVSVGAVTNQYGFYTLTVPAGRYSITAAHLGYDSVVTGVDLRRDTTLNFALVSNAELDAARIVSRKDAGLQSVLPGALEVPVLQLKNTPSLLGEADLIKSLQLLPGVQGGLEGFSGLYVRGGGPEDNLILLDGVPMYNMDHMLGLFSIFQPEAVKDVTLYKGTFPSRYGGRISSILDIRTNDGNMKETHGSFTVGVLNDKFHLEGPIVKNKLSYSLSARGLHSIVAEPFLRMFLKDVYVNYYYYDLNGKLTWKISDRDKLFLGVYHGRDNIGYNHTTTSHEKKPSAPGEFNVIDRKERTDLALNWGSSVASLRWNHVFGGTLFSNSTVFYNRYRMKAGVGTRLENVYDESNAISHKWSIDYLSGISDIGAKMDFDWTPGPSHILKFGAEYLFHNFRPEVYTAIVGSVGEESWEDKGEENNVYFGHEASVYADDNISLGSRFTINPGARLTLFNTQGRSYWSLQPRSAVKFDAGAGFSFKGGYSHMAQYVHLLSSTIMPLPLDIWVPITKDIKPVTSDQFSLGVYHDGLKGWEFSLEGYYKMMDNLLEFKEGVMFLANTSGWENQVDMGQGRAMGLELLVRKTSGRTTGWISYTLSRSEREFPDGSINLGRPYPYKYDRRHAFDIVVNHKFSDRVDVSASWVFASGGWMTIPMRDTKILFPDSEYVYASSAVFSSGRNNYNLPPSHRLNLGINLRRPTARGGESVWNLSLYNAYNAMNPNFVFYNYSSYDNPEEKQSIEKDVVFLTRVTVLPILPAFSYTLNF